MEFSLPAIGRESFKFLFPSNCYCLVKFQKESAIKVERAGKCLFGARIAFGYSTVLFPQRVCARFYAR